MEVNDSQKKDLILCESPDAAAWAVGCGLLQQSEGDGWGGGVFTLQGGRITHLTVDKSVHSAHRKFTSHT